jgi:hypothetical protein
MKKNEIFHLNWALNEKKFNPLASHLHGDPHVWLHVLMSCWKMEKNISISCGLTLNLCFYEVIFYLGFEKINFLGFKIYFIGILNFI